MSSQTAHSSICVFSMYCRNSREQSASGMNMLQQSQDTEINVQGTSNEGEDLLTSSRDSNPYTIYISNIEASSPDQPILREPESLQVRLANKSRLIGKVAVRKRRVNQIGYGLFSLSHRVEQKNTERLKAMDEGGEELDSIAKEVWIN
ncbi:hypothetical protein Tco_0874310 [Tanacetum coccineum]|uniref:Uncharacterized protein n=1 Tax=Tanacetum coccineum TaxID=301880 RepID=A0ABQ5BMY6_9ASTR